MSESKLRADTTEAVEQLGTVLGVLFKTGLEKVGHDKLFRNCSICQNWQEGGENHLGEPTGCRIYQALPPVKVIVCGCDQFVDNEEIPF